MTAEDTPVIRIEHEGRVYRWERPGSAWPGHVSFVALRGPEVVLGDRYAREGIERSYACRLEDLLEGCFGEQLVEQLGEAVHAEVLAEVRHQLGPDDASTPDAAAAQAPEAQAGPQAPPAPADAPPEARAPEPAASEGAARVRVTLSACPSVDLALIVALRAITRGPVADLLPALQAPPCVLAAELPRAQGEAIARRLRSLGATVELGSVTN